MKILSALLALLLAWPIAAGAAPRSAKSSAIGAGIRVHPAHKEFGLVPYDDDLSYRVCYEYHEAIALWQLALNYLPNASALPIDEVLTPELNLLFKDGIWRGGIGVLSSYVKVLGESEWTDVYFQFLLGIEFPVGPLHLQVQAIYPFEDFDALGDFTFDDMEYGALLSWPF